VLSSKRSRRKRNHLKDPDNDAGKKKGEPCEGKTARRGRQVRGERQCPLSEKIKGSIGLESLEKKRAVLETEKFFAMGRKSITLYTKKFSRSGEYSEDSQVLRGNGLGKDRKSKKWSQLIFPKTPLHT